MSQGSEFIQLKQEEKASTTEKRHSSIHLLFILLIPFMLVLCASIYTIYLSFQGADRSIAESFNKNGLEITADDQRFQRAKELDLSFKLHCDAEEKIIAINSPAKIEYTLPESIRLRFIHRVDPELDRAYTLLANSDTLTAISDTLTAYNSRGYSLADRQFNAIMAGKANRTETGKVPGYWILETVDSSTAPNTHWSLRADEIVCAEST